jgi:hypothetical protein
MRSHLAVLALSLAAACAPATRGLHPLDAAHGADFRRAFDEARDHERFVVALSPT